MQGKCEFGKKDSAIYLHFGYVMREIRKREDRTKALVGMEETCWIYYWTQFWTV